jgi:hypothetical protein
LQGVVVRINPHGAHSRDVSRGDHSASALYVTAALQKQ